MKFLATDIINISNYLEFRSTFSFIFYRLCTIGIKKYKKACGQILFLQTKQIQVANIIVSKKPWKDGRAANIGGDGG